MKTLLALSLAAASLAGFAAPQASAAEPAPAAVASTLTLPATARINEVVIIEHRHHHRHYRTVRRVYYRHGERIVVYRRAYY